MQMDVVTANPDDWEEDKQQSELGVHRDYTSFSSALSAAESENAKELADGNIEEAELSLR